MDNEIKNWSLPDDSKKILKEKFKNLKEKIILKVFIKDDKTNEFNFLTKRFTEELGKLSDKILIELYTIEDEISKKYKVTRSPTILFHPDKYNIRFTGAPFVNEGIAFIETIILVSQQKSYLSKESKELLKQLKEKREVRVFVTLTCPYCPGQVINAFKSAIERPDLISAEAVDIMENMDLAQKYNIGAIPQTVINEKTIINGFEPELRFITELVTLKPVEELFKNLPIEGKQIQTDVIIVGGGPAGLTAGIYSARSGLNTIILEKAIIGGQVSITPIVENWPGYRTIPGKQLMDLVTQQVREYVPIVEGEDVIEIKIGKQIEAITLNAQYVGKSLILATGTSHRRLNIPGEDRLYGRGVSYCATCDAYLYKEKQVVVIGGGNTAMTDALYLKNIGAYVTILVRDSEIKGEQPLKKSIEREKIYIIYNTEITEILGEKQVIGIKIKNNKDGTVKKLNTDAVFVAIGEIPNNHLASQIGLKLDKEGYVIIDRMGRTNIPRVYAAGDLTGGVRQIVTAVGSGATAATSAFEDISHPYWITKIT